MRKDGIENKYLARCEHSANFFTSTYFCEKFVGPHEGYNRAYNFPTGGDLLLADYEYKLPAGKSATRVCTSRGPHPLLSPLPPSSPLPVTQLSF